MSFDQKKNKQSSYGFSTHLHDSINIKAIKLTSNNAIWSLVFIIFFVLLLIFYILSPIPQQLIRTWIIYFFFLLIPRNIVREKL